MMTFTTYLGETMCGMCDSLNTVEKRSQGEFTYTVLVGCYDCKEASELHYAPDHSSSHTISLADVEKA